MVVAELEVFHSRSIAPTRRGALGDSRLPFEHRSDPGPVLLASVVAARGAGIVLMHTRADPKTEHFPDYGGRVVDDVRNVLANLRERVLQAGVRSDAIVLDPGPDFAKMPAESVEVMRDLPNLAVHGHPLLLAVSRKYFVGTIINREPHQRLAGTLAALTELRRLDQAGGPGSKS